MIRALSVMVLVGGCGSSHPVEDAGGSTMDAGRELDGGVETVDAYRPPEGPPPDAGPPCEDSDRDGYTDAACGGDDCDDSDPSLSPVASFCESPLVAVRCSAGVTDRVDCGDSGEVCDARLGTCASSACGDGVMHEGEECDDGNATDGDGCDGSCLWEACTRDWDCPRSPASSCSDRRSDDTVYCRARNSGGADLGELCSVDSDCASGWCDDAQLRCTARCFDDTDCPGLTSYCTLWGGPTVRTCKWACFRHADCPPGRDCVDRAPFWTCGFGGPGDIGAPCGYRTDCRSELCLTGACSAHCIDDGDCGPWICRPTTLPYSP